ncbi:MAG: GNAT family N-acetyltransferase [Thermoplasmata archaeon]|nr:GNAT family N-acetyltransferase [Thermoplasmata archaeon]
MSASPTRVGSTGFKIRRLEKPEEFRQVDAVHRAVWGEEASDSVPTALQRAVQDNGGIVLGGFADIHLAGFTVAFLGWDGGTLYLYVHSAAVRPEYQNHHLGFQLLSVLRQEVLQLGLPEVRLAFDPLQSRNAWLFVHRLGGVPDRYLHHYYGQLPDPVNRGIESDRIRLVWTLSSPRVERRLEGKYPTAEEDQMRWSSATPLLRTEPGESGVRLPVEVQEPERPVAHLEIPFDLALVREHESAALGRWRHATRDAFRAAADLGYAVDDFVIVSVDHERRSFYLLSPTEKAPSDTAGPGSAGRG